MVKDPSLGATTSSPYDVVGKSITDLKADMASGKTTAQQIMRAYLDRIAAYDSGPLGLHSVITVAPDAMAQAKAADDAARGGRHAARCSASRSWRRTSSTPRT